MPKSSIAFNVAMHELAKNFPQLDQSLRDELTLSDHDPKLTRNEASVFALTVYREGSTAQVLAPVLSKEPAMGSKNAESHQRKTVRGRTKATSHISWRVR